MKHLDGRHFDRSEAERKNLQLGPNRLSGARISAAAASLLLLLILATPLHAQGCAQCLDSTRATPPQVQSAYRHAIYLLGGFAISLFLAGIALLRRER